MAALFRRLGRSDIQISAVAMGCWPITGMTSLDVNEADSRRTIDTALASGINFFDTAFCYGLHGESESMLGRVIGDRRNRVVYATKGGIHWNSEGQRVQDGRPATIKAECLESLTRLQTDRVELYYLHAPDPNVPIAESAGAIRKLMDEGKVRCAGVSNVSLEQLQEFERECPVTAIQPPYNMLQRDIEQELVPYCVQQGISVLVYWPLMKGLLAGKLPRNHVFQPGDGRAKYPMFQGDEWQKNQDFLDELRKIAEAAEKPVSQIVVNWTIQQQGITAAICGAKRAYQIAETAGSLEWQLSDDQLHQIDEALRRRGIPVTRNAV